MIETTVARHTPARSTLASDPPGYYLGSRTHESALKGLSAGVRDHAGLLILVGEVGAGKTTVLSRLVPMLSGVTNPVLCRASGLDFGQLLDAICSELQLAFTGPTQHAELESTVHSIANSALGPLTLLVDDADRLHGDALEQLLRMSQAIHGHRGRLHLVLSGRSGLLERLRRARATHPIVARALFVELTPLLRGEAVSFLQRLLEHRRAASDVSIPARELLRIAEHSAGVPGTLVTLLDATLSRMEHGGDTSVTTEDIEHADAEMHSDPIGPISGPPPTPARVGAALSCESFVAANVVKLFEWSNGQRHWNALTTPRAMLGAGAVTAVAAVAFGMGTYHGQSRSTTAADLTAGTGPRLHAIAVPEVVASVSPASQGLDTGSSVAEVTLVDSRTPGNTAKLAAKMDHRLERAWLAFRRNALTTPEDDNAVRWAESVLAISPEDPRALEVLRAVVDRYMQWAVANIHRQDVRDAMRFLAKAKSLERHASVKQTETMAVLDGEAVALQAQQASTRAQYRRTSRGSQSAGPGWLRKVDRWLRTLPLP